jgi:hypothetical protein
MERSTARKSILVTRVALIAGLILCGCASEKRSTTGVQMRWQPWTNEVTNPTQMAAALEARWELGMIKAYCNSTPPTPTSVQNLVSLGETWHGTLYEGKASGFDRIWWYASTQNGKLEAYSLNAAKGSKYWNIETGNPQWLYLAPVLSRPKN